MKTLIKFNDKNISSSLEEILFFSTKTIHDKQQGL